MISWIGGKLPANTGHVFIISIFLQFFFQVSNTHTHRRHHWNDTIDASLSHFTSSVSYYRKQRMKKIHEHILFVPNWNSVYYVECVSAFVFPSKNRSSHAKRYVARRIMSFIWLFTRFISNISRKQMRIWIHLCAVRTFIFSTRSQMVWASEKMCVNLKILANRFARWIQTFFLFKSSTQIWSINSHKIQSISMHKHQKKP